MSERKAGAFFINGIPITFFVCGMSECIDLVIESAGGVICDSSKDAQIIIFNRDNFGFQQILWPISLEEKNILEQIDVSVQPVVSSLWVYKCCREQKLIQRLEYIIGNSYSNSTSNIVQHRIHPSVGSTHDQPIYHSPTLGNAVIPISGIVPDKTSSISNSHPLRIDTIQSSRTTINTGNLGRQTNNSLDSRLDQKADPKPKPAQSNPPIIENNITKEEAIIILVEELYRFAHKRTEVTENDIRTYVKDLESRRKERSWRIFYRREHEVVDSILKKKGLDTKNWHNFPPKEISKIKNTSNNNNGNNNRKQHPETRKYCGKGYVWESEDEDGDGEEDGLESS